MFIEIDGEKTTVKPANVDDAGFEIRDDEEKRLFVCFERDGVQLVRRAYTTKKAPAEGERPFFVMIEGAFVPVADVQPFFWCECDGREIFE